MVVTRSAHTWVIWASLALALLLSVAPMPDFMAIGRPLWLALFLSYWALTVPHRLGMVSAWVFGFRKALMSSTELRPAYSSTRARIRARSSGFT